MKIRRQGNNPFRKDQSHKNLRHYSTQFRPVFSSEHRSVLLPFFKSERNSFFVGGISALDTGRRIAKRIQL